MNVLFKKINWKIVRYVGFDMDGTLYDEFEFIVQVYKEISKMLKNGSFEFMCKLWLEKGSSYNKIFEEAFNFYGLTKNINKDNFISKCLDIYRKFNPVLKLPERTKFILEHCKKEYELFLVSDGSPDLQKKKFYSLGLDKYFAYDKVLFTQEYPKKYEKPNTDLIKLLKIEPSRAVYFGDRDIDRDFAINAGMQFQRVYNMIPLDDIIDRI